MKHPTQELAYFCEDLKSYEFLVSLSDEHWKNDLVEYEKSLESDNDALYSRFKGRRNLSVHLQKEFPQYQKRAYLTMLMAVFEDCLNQFSLSLKEHMKLPDDFNSTKGKGIDKARNYIFKTAQFKPISDQTIWERLKEYQDIRNIIVHAAGHLDSNGKNYKKISNDMRIEKYAREHLIINAEYLMKVISDMKKYCGELMLQCESIPNKKIKPTQKDARLI